MKFVEAVEAFPSSALLHMFIASYLRHFRKNQHLEQVHLAAAEAKRPSPDELFMVFARRKQMSEADANSSSDRMTVMQRVHFEKLKTDAIQSSIHAREHQVAFWAELLERHPDITKVMSIGTSIATDTSRAEAAFKHLLHINDRSVYVLRLFAQFLMEVTNDVNNAHRYLEEADAIELEQSKEREKQITNVDVLEQVCVVIFTGIPSADTTGMHCRQQT